jgi:5'-methylthioadenosine phosphorylase
MRPALLSITLLAAGICGCTPQYHNVKLVRPPHSFETIVSLSPGTTEIIESEGAGQSLKGRTAADDYPTMVSSVPIVASLKPDYEKIRQLSPDLVVYDSSLYNSSDLDKIKAICPTTYGIDANSVGDFEKQLYVLGDMLNVQTTMNDYVGRIVDAAQQAEGDRPKNPPKVAVVMPGDGGSPLIAGTSSFVADVVKLAGGIPVGPAADRFVPISPENLVQEDPDIIIIPTKAASAKKDAATLMNDSRLKTITAVRNGALKALDSDVVLRHKGRQLMASAEIGVFGGSGFYSLLEDVREAKVDTPYGPPSDSLFIASVSGRSVAFLPRHGRRHTVPPHKVNYRANVWAMRALGCQAIISPCASGSLQPHVEPGHFVVCDQFVDRTSGRQDTFYEGPIVTHVSAAEIYSPVLRRLAVETIRDHEIVCHETGTVVVIQGPRFSTKAESKWFHDQGWEVINMTQYPEAYLCHELGMGVVNISLITDYDSGVHAGTEAVAATDVLAVFHSNADKIKKVVLDLISRLPADLSEVSSIGGLAFTRGDGHAVSPSDLRLFQTFGRP